MITITAATGQLGQLIIKELTDKLKSTSQLTAVVRNADKASALAQAGIKVSQADYGDTPALQSAFTGTDTLVFISGDAGVEERIRQHRNVVDAAKAAGVKRIIYTSFIDPSPDSPFIFCAIHADTEDYIKANGIPFTFLRNGMYADIDRARQSIQFGVLAAISGDVGVSYITREDIARTAAVVAANPGHENKTYTLTGPSAVTYRQFAELLSTVTGHQIPFKEITMDELKAGLKQANLPEFVVDLVAGIQQGLVEGRYEKVTNDVADLTGKPAADFETVLRNNFANQA